MKTISVMCPICLHHPVEWVPDGDRHYYIGCPDWKCGDFILTNAAKWASEKIADRTKASDAIRAFREKTPGTPQFNENFIKEFIEEASDENAESND